MLHSSLHLYNRYIQVNGKRKSVTSAHAWLSSHAHHHVQSSREPVMKSKALHMPSIKPKPYSSTIDDVQIKDPSRVFIARSKRRMHKAFDCSVNYVGEKYSTIKRKMGQYTV